MDKTKIQSILRHHDERIRKLEKLLEKKDSQPKESDDSESQQLSTSDIHEIKTSIEGLDSPTAAVVGLCIAKKFEEKKWPLFTKDDFMQAYKVVVRTSSKIPVTRDYNSLVKNLRSRHLWIENMGRAKYCLSDVGAQEYLKLFKDD